ncbi:hypothetical protein [Poseidonibacter lekithochrous]|uniref:hypothetical protein n=1 Tax=Poseidonibacter lekithochrous TaxID=1904463 RepID=UPI0008FC8E18|nr:hypothetical protein [Poseidonibacter lekithochrous]QKJ23981.1 hypothetical protein ALEK_2757 [Poseidonibacter lekithochrous]
MLINFKFLPYSVLLSSNNIFNQLSLNFNHTDADDIKKIVFIDHREANLKKPDYIHKNNLLELNEKNTIKDNFLYSYNQLNQLFKWRGNNIFINDEYYYDWQNIVTKIPPISLLTFNLYTNHQQVQNINDIIDQIFNSSTLPSIYNQYLEDLFKNDKLSEMHMHINGTTETEYVWEDALKKPNKFYTELKKSFPNDLVDELYKQLDINYSPKNMFKILQKAKTVRHYLSQVLLSNTQSNSEQLDWNSFLNIENIHTEFKYTKFIPTYGHPYSHMHSFKSFLGYEARFIYDMFTYLNQNDNQIITKLFYYYILSKSIFHQIIVQQTDQYGFDQFEKITVNEVRELSEKKYLNRFTQLKGMYGQDFEYIEARFSPKESRTKLQKLVDEIIIDYEKFIEKNELTYPDLALVAHFIKKKDKRKSKNIYTYRDYPLRVDLKNRAQLLLNLFKSHPKYTYYIRGIDAAGNELYTKPEVFAPSFRYLTKRINLLPTDYYLTEESYIAEKENKVNRYFSKKPELGITFHAGEDFVHLISGIRMVYEAVMFLDMPAKSRIGHATALGISPTHWIKSIGNKLKISRGEWLDNLIFILFFMDNDSELNTFYSKINDNINRYWYEIYNKTPHDLYTLKQAYLCRKICPSTIKNKIPNRIYEIDNEEWKYEKILDFTPSNKSLELFEDYHNPKYYDKYNEIIEVDINEDEINLLYKLQQNMIKLLNEKNIAIETMPTSNVRISFYENYEQHHIFNWYDPKEDPNKLKPNLVVASDDPGIFVNHLRAEFSHLYQTAIKKGATQQQTIQWLKELNHNAKIFRF